MSGAGQRFKCNPFHGLTRNPTGFIPGIGLANTWLTPGKSRLACFLFVCQYIRIFTGIKGVPTEILVFGTHGAIALPEALPHPQWFALTVKRRYEKVVAHSLRRRGLEDFLPLYVMRRCWSDRIKAVEFPLFPGYVFCRFDYDRRLPVLCIPGVTSIVGYAKLPTPLSESEIASIRTILTSNLPAQPWPGSPRRSIDPHRARAAGRFTGYAHTRKGLAAGGRQPGFVAARSGRGGRSGHCVCDKPRGGQSHPWEASLMV